MAQWITRLTTDQKIPGSNPGKLVFLVCFSSELNRKQGKYSSELNIVSCVLRKPDSVYNTAGQYWPLLWSFTQRCSFKVIRHRWFSGIILACHAGGRVWFQIQMNKYNGIACLFCYSCNWCHKMSSLGNCCLILNAQCLPPMLDESIIWKRIGAKMHRPGIEPGPPAWQARILPMPDELL